MPPCIDRGAIAIGGKPTLVAYRNFADHIADRRAERVEGSSLPIHRLEGIDGLLFGAANRQCNKGCEKKMQLVFHVWKLMFRNYYRICYFGFLRIMPGHGYNTWKFSSASKERGTNQGINKGLIKKLGVNIFWEGAYRQNIEVRHLYAVSITAALAQQLR